MTRIMTNFFHATAPTCGGGSVKLWLDDERPAPPGWVRANTATEALRLLAEGDVEEVSLDHDLGIEETGYDVVLWIEEKVFTDPTYSPPRMRVHSANISARKKMEQGIAAITERAAKNRAATIHD